MKNVYQIGSGDLTFDIIERIINENLKLELAPLSAETLPPPGTGSLLSTLLINSLMVSSVNMAISI
jgi:hypothetical protein